MFIMHTTRAPEEVSAISGTGTADSSSLQEHSGFRSEEFKRQTSVINVWYTGCSWPHLVPTHERNWRCVRCSVGPALTARLLRTETMLSEWKK